MVHVLRLWSVSGQTVGACPLGCVVPGWVWMRAEVHLGMLGGFLGQFGLLLLVGLRPSGARLGGVRVPGLCQGWLRAPC